jgi:hypothetical protein
MILGSSCVAPANGDLSNQAILNLIKSEHIENSRVVGVFTKIDKLEEHEARGVSSPV